MSSTDLADDFLGGPAAEEEPQWSGEQLEAAYLRALEALDAVESEIVATAEEVRPGAMAGVEEAPAPVKTESPAAEIEEPAPLLSPRQVLEACLFVGGTTLTAAKLASLLRGDYTATFVEETIDALNQQYATEGRPYTIQLGEGGYRFALREEYERLRNKVYGLGPREVRLSQDVLEILAIIAYQQPVSDAHLEELERGNANGILRQLLRRELIAVERPKDDPKLVQYRTTPRFLSLFGLGSLNDLPRPEDLSFK
ncbi:MAG: SMC-Scp complex subunit ScpB [Planctomycetaceae bacterium]|nr:SMC-Scp complex subunit ScpB [Planctomycetaceae bacterium]